MRTHARTRPALLAPVLLLALAGGLAHAQVSTAPPVQPVPPARPDPTPPVSPVPVPPPQQAGPATPAVPAPAATPAAPARAASPATLPAPPESTPPAAAAHQAAELAKGDPTRWYKEDATEEQRLRTQRKEIGAAYEEARIGCRRVVASERAQCLKDARATYEKDLSAISSKAGVR